MAEFITLSCLSCGHKLQITLDIDRFACVACGNEHNVYRNGGMVTLKPIIDRITNVQAGVDKSASELAIARLQTEIEDLKSKIKAIDSNRSVGERGILLAGFFVILAIILLAFDSTRLVGLFIIIATILIYIFSQRETTEDKEIHNELKKLINELDMKEEELQTNQQAVLKI
jgi:hypothetical protein